MAEVPVFFELSWSILCTICFANVFLGALVCGITSWTLLAAVPMISSGAGAIANGLCYYVYYEKRAKITTVVLSVFGDVCWLVQEAGLLFYSYIILSRVLSGLRWRVFASLFWTGIVGIIVIRVVIIVFRVRSIFADNDNLLPAINQIHIAYFGLMAILECLGAYFLVVIFTSAKASSAEITHSGGLFQYLARSTEMRVALLALQGTLRAIIHSFTSVDQKAVNIVTQFDRFLYTLFCLYSMVLYIDLLSSKLKSGITQDYPSSRDPYAHHNTQPTAFTSTRRDDFAQNGTEHVVGVNAGKSKTRNDSTDLIIKGGSSLRDGSINLEDMDHKCNVIKKTVEFRVV
ncbi:hypothetical protein FOXG_22280 [Fusarium oxysporum f. sp. lycopersici 4287]|uniref:Integral membrane protein n=2 Tax=Fusarium oxysporum TaxID=5507 RepID=A0A0J9W7E5_FUSO4|nr:hypothetical protein FOXG_22280 [Fusarium oxysporum f. sp. lycopersici 4287]EXK26501.1 hypothetical protein FOMG_16905 [Fusarium oxysporum f. sp. melonis 26406]KAJ9412664.1 hypothetical protein QL093DRAFT_2629231 [Fusarium oxysporum]KNB18551.1 hypothetical protein FOXG_22280 [Fusarium oxysporum f. sp. lycopersici 4287]